VGRSVRREMNGAVREVSRALGVFNVHLGRYRNLCAAGALGRRGFASYLCTTPAYRFSAGRLAAGRKLPPAKPLGRC
jgi:hypothetical protein